jgi:hypothetical protein
VAFAANATVVGLGRLGSLGLKQVGSQLRYDTEMTWLLPLALGFALFPGEVAGRGEREGSALRRGRRRLGSRPVRIGIVAAVLCAYLAATIDTGRDTSNEWRRQASDQSKAYTHNLQRDAARLSAAGQPLTTIDDQTPAYLIGPGHKPWNRLERLAPAIVPAIHVAPAAPDPLEIHQDGRVTPAQVQGLATGPSSVAGAGEVRLEGGERFRRHGYPCVATHGAPAVISFATEPELAGQSLFAKLTYAVDKRGPRPAVITGNTYRGGRFPVPLDRRRGRLVLNLGHRLRAELPPGTSVCLRSSSVGWVMP